MWDKLIRSFRRASRKHSESEIQEAAQFALIAYKMHLRGWRTHKWFLPSKDKQPDSYIYFWDEPAHYYTSREKRQKRRDGWQPGKGAEHLCRWFGNIWAAVKVVEKWTGR